VGSSGTGNHLSKLLDRHEFDVEHANDLGHIHRRVKHVEGSENRQQISARRMFREGWNRLHWGNVVNDDFSTQQALVNRDCI